MGECAAAHRDARKPWNRGCGLKGGWTCTATNQGWFSQSAIVGTRRRAHHSGRCGGLCLTRPREIVSYMASASSSFPMLQKDLAA